MQNKIKFNKTAWHVTDRRPTLDSYLNDCSDGNQQISGTDVPMALLGQRARLEPGYGKIYSS